MATKKTINVYGMGYCSPEELAERATWHETTWVESEIPEAIYKDVLKYIQKKSKAFEKQCGCGLCKLHKK